MTLNLISFLWGHSTIIVGELMMLKKILIVCILLSILSIMPVIADLKDIPVTDGKTLISNGSYWITIEPIGDKYVGEKITIIASTNIPVGEEIIVDIGLPTPQLCPKAGCTEVFKESKILVKPGNNSLNKTVFDFETSDFAPNEYFLREQSFDQKTQITINFNLLAQENVTPIIPSHTPTSENYFIEFDAIGDHFTGDTFFVNGTTNLPAGENLTIEIFESNLGPYRGPFSVTSSVVLVQPGKNDLNYWSAKISPENWTSYSKHGKILEPVSGFVPGEFSAQVFSLNHGMTNQSNLFNIFPEGTNWTTGPDSNPPTPTSSFPLILTLVAIAVIAVLTIVQRTGRG